MTQLLTQPDLVARFDHAMAAPSWTTRWLGEAQCEQHGDLVIHRGDNVTLITVRHRDARLLRPTEFRAVTAELYREIRERVGDLKIVRIWNHVPGIHDRLTGDNGIADRYQLFNAGRFDAMRDWFFEDGSSTSRLRGENLPAASGIGHAGNDLVIHALATMFTATAMENPAQVPAFEYSTRYGLLPPCFSRAMFVQSPSPMLLISGTASIRGENSLHDGDLIRQWSLTIENLRSLIESPAVRVLTGANKIRELRDLRIYVHPLVEASALHTLASTAFPNSDIEWFPAEICRAELLVEIEANLPVGQL